MNQPISKADEIIDYSFLLLSHIVCADGQIHNKEAQALHELAQQSNMGKRTIEEMEKILAQDENSLSVEDIADKVPPGEQNEAMRQMLAIAYIDGFFSPLEREMVDLVAEIWNWQTKEVERLIQETEGLGTSSSNDEKEQLQLSFGARLLKQADSILSHKLVDKLGEIAPENVGLQIERLRREILLTGAEYDHAIEQCTTVAVEDYQFATLALKKTGLALQDLGKGIQKQLEAVVENFKKLAYEKGYRWKMMLVINKMSDEAGEEAQKIANYRKSLAEAIKPHNLDEFPVCFIDAKDYCEGVDEDEEFLIEISRFQTFIDALNTFVEKRAALARFDTPVRIALSLVDEAQLSFTRNSTEDSAFLEVLTRLSRTVRKERDRLRTKIKSIALEMSAAIAKEGVLLASAVATEQDFEKLNKQAELNVQQQYEQAETKLQNTVNSAVEDIREEVKEVLQGNLVQTFIACLGNAENVSTENVASSSNTQRLQEQVNFLKQIGETAGVNLNRFATSNSANIARKGFLTSMNVAGSGLHQTVLAVGKFVGFKFQPWQAVGIAKGIGNAAIFLGPALAIVSIGIDCHQMHQEKEQEKKIADVKWEITSEFQKIAKDLENQIELQLWEFEQQVYGEIEKQIIAARKQEEQAIATSNTSVKQLLENRNNFNEIIRYIQKVTANSAAKNI
ncbi:MAG: TerB family tellurite resistance protein [Rivularia sp. (in: cyanobacteria)]